MGKKTVWAALVFSITVLISLALAGDAWGNPINYGPPTITLVSPQYGKIYNSSQITLSTEIQLYGYTYSSLEVISSAKYAVDNGVTQELTLQMPREVGPGTKISSTNILSDLSYGIHTVSVFLETSFGESATANTSFTVAPRPSAPDFSVSLVGSSSVEVTVKNQPLNAFQLANGSYPSLYYGFRFWDHRQMIGEWEYAPPFFVGISSYGTYYKASDSNSTVVTLSLENYNLPSLSNGGQIDFQAMALVGNEYPTTEQGGTVYGFDGEESSWNTQTVAIPEPSPSPSPSQTTSPTPTLSPTLSPTQQPTMSPTPTFSPVAPSPINYGDDINTLLLILGIVAVALGAVALGTLFCFKKRKGSL